MNRLLSAFVVLTAITLLLCFTAKVSAEKFSNKVGVLKQLDPKTMTFCLECSDPKEKWPNLSVKDPAVFKSLNMTDTYTVDFDYKGNPKGDSGRGDVITIKKK